LLRCFAAAAVVSIAPCVPSWAQTPGTSTPQQQLPPPEVLAGLIRWTLTALSQANATGNYSVLRELGSPEFQATNSAAKLAGVFAALREKKVSLAFVAISTPQLTQPPAIDAKGVLRVVGFYAVRPLQVTFDLSFQSVNGGWRHSAISLGAAPPPASSAPAPPAAPTPESRQPAAKKKQ
jgi:hypothetical protein